jgi:large subunit ribosomal protein L31
MRSGIHPEYRTVVFRDAASGALYRTRSTVATTQTIDLDGETLPLVTVDISAASHPFWTGNQRVLDTAGRVERFHQRYARHRAGRGSEG